MSVGMEHLETDYDVGYGRPPRQHQFEKGQLGNPNGRPKRSDPADVDIDTIISQPVAVVHDGVARSVPPKEVALRRLPKKSISSGDLRAIIYLLKQFEKHGLIN